MIRKSIRQTILHVVTSFRLRYFLKEKAAKKITTWHPYGTQKKQSLKIKGCSK